MGNLEVTHDLIFLLFTGCPELLMTFRTPHALVPNYFCTSNFLPQARTHAESMQFCRYTYAAFLQTVVPVTRYHLTWNFSPPYSPCQTLIHLSKLCSSITLVEFLQTVLEQA